MIDKIVGSIAEALGDVVDGSTLLVGGFGDVGVPFALLDGLVERGVRNLVVAANNCGTHERGLALLFKHRMVSRIYASFPAQAGNHHFVAALEEGATEVVIVPQGTLAERIRCAGAGLGGFYTPTAAGTELGDGKEVRLIGDRPYVLEEPLAGDFALVHAHRADRFGNLRFRRAARNFNPIMAMAARTTIVEVEQVVPAGALDADDVHLPGIFVDRVVEVGR